MSFNYNPSVSNQLPMMPIMNGMPTGPAYLTPQSFANSLQQMSTGATPAMLSAMAAAGLNDQPLDFNVSKKPSHAPSVAIGAGPMDLETITDQMMDRDRNLMRQKSLSRDDISLRCSADRRLDDGSNGSSLDNSEKGSNNNAALSAPMTQTDVLRMMGIPQSLMMMPIMNMMDMGMQSQYPMLGQMSHAAQPHQPQPGSVHSDEMLAQTIPNGVSMKEVITCKSCSLIPPSPNSPQPTTRDRPPGCRTVFVGGLPENVTEDIIREVFERCGEITTLRLSKKNFCHIRYVYESAVDSAIYLSGYRIRLAGATSSATCPATEAVSNCGRLHVDYAQARDDQYEWECKQRQLQREQRHRDRMELDRMRPHSPPPVVHFTDHEASAIADKLKQDEHFQKAVQVLVTWLERGDCSKKNANTFYSMIQSTNSHVRRLQNEKSTFEDELQRAKDNYRKQMYSMCAQFNQIEKVFGAASHKKVWDHFTKAQRKNIDLWKKQSTEIRSMQLDDLRDNDEMDLSDDERDGPRSAKRGKFDNRSLLAENDNLKSELASYRSDADMVKSMLEFDTDIKEKQLKVLQETIRNLQTQLLENKTREKENLNRVADLETRLKQANVKELLLKTKIVEASKLTATTNSAKVSESDDGTEAKIAIGEITAIVTAPSPPPISLVQPLRSEPLEADDARIVGLVSTFLVVHPFGASLDYVFSYVQRSSPHLRPKQLEEILSRYKSIFSEEVTGVGAKIERKWKFCGFEPIDPAAPAEP